MLISWSLQYLLLLIIPCFMKLSTFIHLGYHSLPILDRPLSISSLSWEYSLSVYSQPTAYLTLWLLSHGFGYHLHAINSQKYPTTDLASIGLYTHQPGWCVHKYLNFGISKVELTIFYFKPSPPLVFFLSLRNTQLSKLWLFLFPHLSHLITYQVMLFLSLKSFYKFCCHFTDEKIENQRGYYFPRLNS